MARHPMNRDAMVVRGLRIPVEMNEQLDKMPNASDFIRQALQVALAGNNQEQINQRMSEVEREIIELEREHHQELSKLRERKVRLEAMFRQGQVIAEKATDMRLAWLERYAKVRRNARYAHEMKGWLEGRVELLKECDFKDLDEAYTTLEAEYARTKLVR